MSSAIIDACCFINLYATGDLRDFLTKLKWSWHIPSVALAESLYIRATNYEDGDTQIPIEPQPYIDEDLITVVDIGNSDEAELYVRLAGDLDDGEAMALALARLRGWKIATDDRKAQRFAGDLGVAVITTPEMMRHWTKASKMRQTRIKALLTNIQIGANYVPAENARGYDWWTSQVNEVQ